MPQALLTQSWNFESSRWSGIEARSNMVHTWTDLTCAQKKTLHRDLAQALLTNSWSFVSSSWSGIKARPKVIPIWSKHGPYMGQKSTHSIEMCLRLCWLIIENLETPTDLEAKLGQKWCPYGPNMVFTWSKHDPDMVLKIRYSIERCLKLCWLSHENFQISSWSWSKARPNMVPIWSRHGPDMGP